MNRLWNKASSLMAPQKYFRVLGVSLGTGLILTVLQYFLPAILFYGAKEWTPNMTHRINWIIAVIAIVLFLFSGFFFFQDMTPGQITLSALTFSAYTALVLFLEWFTQTVFHFFPPILLYFMVPCALPMQPYYLLGYSFGFPPIRILIWLGATLTSMIYILFGRKQK